MKINQEVGLVSNYRFVRATPESMEQIIRETQEIDASSIPHLLPALINGEPWAARRWLRAVKSSLALFPDLVSIGEYHNIVPSVLRNSLATLISGTLVTPTFKAKYMALGSGSTAAANTDTQLGTETLRGLFTSSSALLNVASLDKFFSTAEVGGITFNEAGIFVDGSASANSGYLLSRVLINEAMGANETLTINATFTIS